MPKSFVDARQADLEDQSAHFCVVGGGAAGLTLAAELASAGRKVVLLEGGGLEFDLVNQDLFLGESIGLPYLPLESARVRMLGGTTNHWQGFCHPIRPRDFEPVPGLELTGWPIEYHEIEPYFHKSERMLGFGEDAFLPSSSLSARTAELTQLSDVAEIRVLRQVDDAYLRFGTFLGPQLERRDNVDVFLNANVTHITLNQNGDRVSSVLVKTTSGRSFRVSATYFVLACHGIENARLLLDSNDVQKQGIGNSSDWVGRCFMEHPVLETGYVTNLRGVPFPTEFNVTEAARDRFWAVLTTPEGTEQRQNCLQTMSFFQKKGPTRDLKRAAYRFLQGLKKPYQDAMMQDLMVVLDNMQASVDESVSGREEFSVRHVIEQAPNPSSRVTLSDETNSLGSRRPVLDWQLREEDYRTFRAAQDATANFLGAASIGRTFDPDVTAEKVSQDVYGWFHHIGTTRMSDAETKGVVDRDCRVHSVNNLYVAGSSVFCRALYGPTMAIVAFSLRLADHLKKLG